MADHSKDFYAKFLSDAGREQFAARIRTVLGFGPSESLPPISQVITLARERVPECRGLEIVVRSDDQMQGADAIAVGGEIIVGQSMSLAIFDDLPHARCTVTHELVHTIFHPSDQAKFRMTGGTDKLSSLPFVDRQNSAEEQADGIARAILMPPVMVTEAKSVAQLAKRARVTQEEAAERWNEFYANEKTRLWNDLPMIDSESARMSRQCGKFRILWAEYGKTTQCGWFIENGRIVAFFERIYR